MPGRKQPTAISQSIKRAVATQGRADDTWAELERLDFLGDSRREQRTKSAVHGVVVAFVVIVGGLIIAATAVFMLNLMLPQGRRWLTDDQVQKLSLYLTTGVIGGAFRSMVGHLSPEKGRSRRQRRP